LAAPKKNSERYENIAAQLYEKRLEDDAAAGRSKAHLDPHARSLYFRGANDILKCLRIWLNEVVPPDLPDILDALETQSRIESEK